MFFDIGIKDFIDVLLVAFLLYYTYKLMKASGSIKVFTGILVFILIWLVVTQVLEMKLLGSIFDTLMSVGVIALIVLFQDEIRRFLLTLGSHRHVSALSRLFNGSKKESLKHDDIMPVVMACLSMGKQKVGALIVIEHNTPLDEIVRTGEVIDAAINQRLIENIFFKNSPLHDGAMVISKKRNIISSKYLVDEIAAIIGGGKAEEHIPTAIFCIALIVGVTLLAALINYLVNEIKNVYSEWFNEYFEVGLSEKVMKMDFEHTEDPDTLDQMNKAKEGMSWYSGGVVGILNGFFNIVSNGVNVLGVIAIIAITCPLLLPIQIISLVLITIFTNKSNKLDIEYFKKLSKINRLFAYFFYQLSDPSNGKEVRLFDSKDMMCDKADYYSNKTIDTFREQYKAQYKYMQYSNLTNGLRDGLSYFYIGFKALTGAITLGDFTMCVSSASTLYWGLYSIVDNIAATVKACGYAYEYLKFDAISDRMIKGDKPVSDGEHVIEFRNVSFKYPRSENYVLRNINITIKQGEHLSVVGLNGAGKTTFIKLLCRMYDVTDGEILIDNINIKDYSDSEYRKLFSVVFQDFELFAFSLKENIILDEQEDEEKLIKTLKMAGLYEDAMKLENKLDTTIFKSYDEKGTELSGGQQQKTAICRALYRDSPIVILDEPTAALDPVAEYEIYKHFNELVGGKTAIYISHRLSSCKFCDEIAVFADDTIKEYGTHDELVKIENGIYSEMYNAQAKYYVENVS